MNAEELKNIRQQVRQISRVANKVAKALARAMNKLSRDINESTAALRKFEKALQNKRTKR